MIVFWDAVALNVKTINNISDKKICGIAVCVTILLYLTLL